MLKRYDELETAFWITVGFHSASTSNERLKGNGGRIMIFYG